VTLPEEIAWAVFLGVGSILWVAGIRLFLRSGLTRRKKVGWTAFLVAVGAGVGLLLPLSAIRGKFLLLLAALPLLALLDVKLAGSNRTFSFWLRACGFEICTVFGSAAILRWCLGLIRRAP